MCVCVAQVICFRDFVSSCFGPFRDFSLVIFLVISCFLISCFVILFAVILCCDCCFHFSLICFVMLSFRDFFGGFVSCLFIWC